MIIEYNCKNFASIGDEIKFSMLSSSDTSLKNNFYTYKNNINILKESVIYGANGSGKTNFIKSLDFFRRLVVNSNTHKPGDKIRTFMNKLMLNENTEFLMHFISNNTRYLYGFSYNTDSISEEYLYYYPNNKISKIFERKNEEITYGENFKKDLSVIEKDYLKANRLLLSCAADRKNIKEILDAYLFFNTSLVIYKRKSNPGVYSAKLVSDMNMKKVILNFMHRIGKKSLVDITSKIKSIKIPEESDPFNDENYEAIVQPKFLSIPEVKFVYKDYELDFSEESDGIQELFKLFFPFIDIIVNKKVFVCDEFETHLHPLIVKELINLFKSNSKESQMIFSTHDVNLLNLSIFRRDQIWFTEQKEKDFTDLYSLSELKSVRKDENIRKNYILGKYSGIPMINEDIKNNLLKDLKNDR